MVMRGVPCGAPLERLEHMSDTLVDGSCAAFAGRLAARTSVPGGGGAIAYAGALAAALGSMAGEFTIGKARYARYQDDLERMLGELADVRERLLGLVDGDARAFAPLAAAYALPKDDPTRADAIELATKGATKVPLQVMEETCRAIGLLEEMEEKCSAMLVADVGCGAALAEAALEGAGISVYVNTHNLRDREFADDAEGRSERMLQTFSPKAREVSRRVMARVRGRDQIG